MSQNVSLSSQPYAMLNHGMPDDNRNNSAEEIKKQKRHLAYCTGAAKTLTALGAVASSFNIHENETNALAYGLGHTSNFIVVADAGLALVDAGRAYCDKPKLEGGADSVTYICNKVLKKIDCCKDSAEIVSKYISKTLSLGLSTATPLFSKPNPHADEMAKAVNKFSSAGIKLVNLGIDCISDCKKQSIDKMEKANVTHDKDRRNNENNFLREDCMDKDLQIQHTKFIPRNNNDDDSSVAYSEVNVDSSREHYPSNVQSPPRNNRNNTINKSIFSPNYNSADRKNSNIQRLNIESPPHNKGNMLDKFLPSSKFSSAEKKNKQKDE